MGSARVQYEMERTLSSLQLATRYGLFSKEVELRAITQRRRAFENALVRRHALVQDYLDYLKFEEDLEVLRVLRVTRLKDQNEIPRSDMIKMQKEAISHIISIFERGVKRLKFNYLLWETYISWAHRKKMRVVVSRISARALSLFPNKVELWLLVANIEMNDFQSASTARALLQRGLRLNSISHSASIQVQAEERPKKKIKRGKSDEAEPIKTLHITPAGNEVDDRATMIMSDKEQSLVRLWIEYIRMELVFLERLRRRRVVLGISGGTQEAALAREEKTLDEDEHGGIEEVPVNNDGEVAPPTLESIKEGAEMQEMTTSESLLLGSIPKSALRSAVSLQSANSMPPKTHFVFLLALTNLVQQFPFYNDTEGVRSGLLQVIQQAAQSRFPTNSNAMLFTSAAPLLDSTTQSKLEELSELELKEELYDSKELKAAANLCPRSEESCVDKILSDCLQFTKGYTAEKEDKITEEYLFHLLEQNLKQVPQSTQMLTFLKTILDSIRDRSLRLDQPGGSHMAYQLRLIGFLEESVGSMTEGGGSLKKFLYACFKRVLHDAKELHCQDVEIEREGWRGQYKALIGVENQDEVKGKLRKMEGRLWETCEQYPSDETLILCYAQVMALSSRLATLSLEELLDRWNRVHHHEAGKVSGDAWSGWADWVKQVEERDAKWKVAQFEGAISKTVGSPSTHQILLEIYLSDSRSKAELVQRIGYIGRKAYPQASFWRFTIGVVGSSPYEFSGEEERDLTKELYVKLTRSGEDVDDYCAYLRFLMYKAGDPLQRLQVFQDLSSRLRDTVDKKTTLEQEWEKICLDLRG
jgi:hypothetical protein